MLLQFSVENFMSIKDEATLYFSANAAKELPNNIINFKRKKFLRSVGIFGANAAGKSTVCRALLVAVNLIRQSNIRQVGQPLTGIIPFKFDNTTLDKPSVFKFLFVENGIKYYYAFIATSKEIISEVLYKYETSKPTLIFQRENITEYKFSKQSERFLKSIKDRNTANKFFLATATNWNDPNTRDAFMWFSKRIDVVCDGNMDMLLNLNRYLQDEEHTLKKFSLNLLQEADIGITDFNVKASQQELIPQPFLNVPSKVNVVEIKTKHIVDSNNQESPVELDLQEESNGTQVLFALAPMLEETFANGKVLCIDEIDTHLHPKLVELLISLFHNERLNTNGAQLIFTTHNLVALSLDLLRRDQLYFVQKDRKALSTELYSLAEFSVRKEENVRKAYLIGRFGAIPQISL